MILEEKYLDYSNKNITKSVIKESKNIIKYSKNFIADMKIVSHKFENTKVGGFIDDYINNLKKSIQVLEQKKLGEKNEN